MRQDTFALYKAKYEEVYGVPLAYSEAENSEEKAEEKTEEGGENKCSLCG